MSGLRVLKETVIYGPRLRALALVACAALATACGSGKSEPGIASSQSALVLGAQQFAVTLTTPKGIDPGDVTLASTAGTELETNAVVSATNPALITNMTSNTELSGIVLDFGAAAGTAESSNNILLQSNSHLSGDALSPQVTVLSGATVSGMINRNPALDPRVNSTFTVSFPSAQASDVVVLPLLTKSLTPGRYRNITVSGGGKLILTGGAYYIENMWGQPGSTISIDDAAGSVAVYTRLGLNLGGTVKPATSTGVLPPTQPLFVHVGTTDVVANTPLRGVIVAASARLSLFGGTGQYQGAFFARHIEVESGVHVTYEPANALVPLLFPPTGHGPGEGLQACVDALKVRADLPPAQRLAALQADVNHYCAMRDVSPCLGSIAGRVQADYTAAADAVIAGTMTPAQNLAVTRDRTRKIHAAQDNSALATALCTTADDDGDLVENRRDACPNTPPLTATDDRGCTDPTLPPAPSAEDVAKLIARGGVLLNPNCRGAKPLPVPSVVAFFRFPLDGSGHFIVAGRVHNQPVGCPIWYFFDIDEIQTHNRYTVAFAEREEVTSLAGLGIPVPPGFIQFQALPDNFSTRGRLANAFDIRFRVKSMNGDGMYSGWSARKIPTPQDCNVLGIHCN